MRHLIIFAVSIIALVSCSNERTYDHDISEQRYVVVEKWSIEVGEKNFESLVAFITDKGTKAEQEQHFLYVFFDTEGNSHAFAPTFWENPEKPKTAQQISVWAYYSGVEVQDSFFSYKITPETVEPMVSVDNHLENLPAIKRGYEEFLAKVKADEAAL